ncbi:MAG: hypothetical protein CEE40_00180 [Chloroflexi bacterium B3_Chlor]|nr:MAG: hypothetical protein CEE40_00180 [Chloroflexi bacterium B3_Chlor]
MHDQLAISIDEELYQVCDKCVARKLCRGRPLVQVDPGEVKLKDPSRGFDCRRCIRACPFGAISARQASVPI